MSNLGPIRVEAVRNDAWVRAHGAPVEVEKQGLERGTYQHPEIHDQPAELGMDYRPTADHQASDRAIDSD